LNEWAKVGKINQIKEINRRFVPNRDFFVLGNSLSLYCNQKKLKLCRKLHSVTVWVKRVNYRWNHRHSQSFGFCPVITCPPMALESC